MEDNMVKFIRRYKNIKSVISFEIRAFVKSLITLIKVKIFPQKYYGAKLDIGCGLKAQEGFIGVDIHWQVDCPFDLRIGLPFPDNSISFISTSHTLEHFSYDELKYILRDWFRVLQCGGKLSISVPYVHTILKSYSLSKEEFQKSVYYWYAQELETKLDIINFLFYMQGEHKNSFDEENLKFLLEKTGFCNVVIRKFDKE